MGQEDPRARKSLWSYLYRSQFLPISKGYFYLLSSYILKSLFDTENNKPKIA